MARTDRGSKSFVSASNSEQVLVRAAVGGSEDAFAELVRLHHRRVSALGMSFFKNRADTEDFVQDVFIKAYTKLGSFKGDSLFSTWLTRIAYTTAVNSIKRRREYLPLADEGVLFDPDWTPEQRELRRITVEVVRACVRELPERLALCLELYFFHDMSYVEICSVTDQPMNTVKSNIFRAKRLLRDKLSGRL